MPEKITALFNSRRFWLAVAGVVHVATQHFGFTELSEQDSQHFVTVIVGWIVGDSINKTK